MGDRAFRSPDEIKTSVSTITHSLSAEIKRHKRSAMLLVATIVIGVTAFSYFFYFSRVRGRSAISGETTAKPAIRSLAVLPLENLSGDASQDYFADGMTEELNTELAKIGTLRVISRSSTMGYKGTRKSIPEIARELNVEAIVQGSVLRSGDKVRINTQLFSASTGQNLWANSYERALRDVLSLQGEVARGIVDEIKIKLTPQEQAVLTRARSINPEAQDAYLKGLDYFNQGVNNPVREEKKVFYEKSLVTFNRQLRSNRTMRRRMQLWPIPIGG